MADVEGEPERIYGLLLPLDGAAVVVELGDHYGQGMMWVSCMP